MISFRAVSLSCEGGSHPFFGPSSLMFHNFGCSACMEKPQIETRYRTLNLILGYVLLTSPLPQQQNNDHMKSINQSFSLNLAIICESSSVLIVQTVVLALKRLKKSIRAFLEYNFLKILHPPKNDYYYYWAQSVCSVNI